MAIEIVKVKVRPLSREAMKPYGDILDEDHPILPTVDPGEGAVAFEINTLERNGKILAVHAGDHRALNWNVELPCFEPSVTERARTLRKLHSLQLMRMS
jgi:hypothetical protein